MFAMSTMMFSCQFIPWLLANAVSLDLVVCYM